MSNRPKRKRGANASSSKEISSAYFLGYVDDEETPEMIEKKFAELERFEKEKQISKGGASSTTETSPVEFEGVGLFSDEASAASGQTSPAVNEPALTLEEQEEMFKRTSTFSVGVVAAQREAELDHRMSPGGREDSEDEARFSSASDNEFDRKRRKAMAGGGGGAAGSGSARSGGMSRYARGNKKGGAGGGAGAGGAPGAWVEQFNDTFGMRKKLAVPDPLMVTMIRLPEYPLPEMWGKMISPFGAKNSDSVPGSYYFETESMLGFDWSQLPLTNDYEAILMDPPYTQNTMKELSKLPIPKLMKRGYIFIWVEKEHTHEVVDLMKKWRYEYVENLVWVKLLPNGKFATQDYKYLSKSKCTLFIFKKDNEETKKMELRHQRNPDVVFDFIRPGKYLTEDKPPAVYTTVETLLPTSNYQQSLGTGKMLELWAKRGTRRKGWTSIALIPPQTSPAPPAPAPVPASAPIPVPVTNPQPQKPAVATAPPPSLPAPPRPAQQATPVTIVRQQAPPPAIASPPPPPRPQIPQFSAISAPPQGLATVPPPLPQLPSASSPRNVIARPPPQPMAPGQFQPMSNFNAGVARPMPQMGMGQVPMQAPGVARPMPPQTALHNFARPPPPYFGAMPPQQGLPPGYRAPPQSKR